MAGYAMKSLLAAAVFGSMAAASFGSAQAYESGLDACSKWTNEEAGEQYKCFDCMKLVGAGPSRHWANTCEEHYGYVPPRRY